MLTQDQIKANIDALQQQGASHDDIQGWLDSLKTQQTPTPDSLPKPQTTLGKINQAIATPEATFGKVATNVATGFAKGVASTAFGGLGLVDKAVKKLGGTPLSEMTSPAEKQFEQKITTPQGTAQKVGAAGEQVAELMTPIGVEGFGAKLAAKAPALGLLFKSLAGAAEVGTKSAVQTGGDVSKTVEGAIAGASGPIINSILAPAFEKAAPQLARYLEKANLRLTPTQKTNMEGKIDDVTNFILKNKVTGTPEQRFNQVSQIYESYEPKLQSYLDKASQEGANVNKKDLLGQLESLKQEYKFDRDKKFINSQIDEVKNLIADNYKKADVIPVNELNITKRSTYKNAFNKAGDKVSDAVEFQMGDIFKKSIENATDGKTIDGINLSDFNKEYGTVINAKKLLKIAKSRAELGFTGKIISSIAGETVGGAFGGPVGAAAGAVAGPTIAKGFAGTLPRSAMAQMAEGISKLPQAAKVSSKIPAVMLPFTR